MRLSYVKGGATYEVGLPDSDFEIQRSYSTFSTYSFSIKVPKWDESLLFFGSYIPDLTVSVDRLPGYEFVLVITGEDKDVYSVNLKQREYVRPEKFGDMIRYDQFSKPFPASVDAYPNVLLPFLGTYTDPYTGLSVGTSNDLAECCFARTSFPASDLGDWASAPLYVGSDTLTTFNSTLKSAYSPYGEKSNPHNMVAMVPVDYIFGQMASPYMDIDLSSVSAPDSVPSIYVGANCIKDYQVPFITEVSSQAGRVFNEYAAMTEGTIETASLCSVKRATLYAPAEDLEVKDPICFSQVLGSYKAPSTGWYEFVVDVEHTIGVMDYIRDYLGLETFPLGGSIVIEDLAVSMYAHTMEGGQDYYDAEQYFAEYQLVKKGADHKPVTNVYNSATITHNVVASLRDNNKVDHYSVETESIKPGKDRNYVDWISGWGPTTSQVGAAIDDGTKISEDYVAAIRFGNPVRIGDTYDGYFKASPQLLDFIVPDMRLIGDYSSWWDRIDISSDFYKVTYKEWDYHSTGYAPIYDNTYMPYCQYVQYLGKKSSMFHRFSKRVGVINVNYDIATPQVKLYTENTDDIYRWSATDYVHDTLTYYTRDVGGRATRIKVYLEEGEEYEFRQVTLGTGYKPLKSSTVVASSFIVPCDKSPLGSEEIEDGKVSTLTYSYFDTLKDVKVSDFIQGIQEAYPEICVTDNGITDKLADITENIHIDVDYDVDYPNAGKVMHGSNYKDDKLVIGNPKDSIKKYGICEDYQNIEPMGSTYKPPYVVKSDKNSLVSSSKVPTLSGLVFAEYDDSVMIGHDPYGIVWGCRSTRDSVGGINTGNVWRAAKVVTGFDQLSKVYKFHGVADTPIVMLKPFKFEFKGDYYVCKEIDRLNFGTNYFEISCIKANEVPVSEPIYLVPSDYVDDGVLETSDGDLFQLRG